MSRVDVKSLLSKKFAVDHVVNMASIGVVAVSGFLLNVLIGKFYGAESLGTFNQIFAVYAVTSALALFGINTSTLKYVAETHDVAQQRGWFSNGVLITLGASFFVVLGFLALRAVGGLLGRAHAFQSGVFIALLGLPLFCVTRVVMAFYNAKREMIRFAKVQVAKPLFMAVALGLCVQRHLSFDVFIYSLPLADCIVFALFVIPELLANFRPRWVKSFAREHLRFGAKSMVIYFLGELYDKIDILVLGFFVPLANLGVYSFATVFARSLLNIASVTQNNFNPIISSHFRAARHEILQDRVRTVRKYNFWIVSLVAVAMLLAYPLVIRFGLKNAAFEGSFGIFAMILGGIYFFSVFSWSWGLLSMTGKPELQIGLSAATALFCLVVTVPAVKFFGVSGAAAAVILSNVFNVVVLDQISRRSLKIGVLPSI